MSVTWNQGEAPSVITVTNDEELEFDRLLRRVRATADGDSNDDEIEALIEALDEALGLLSWDRLGEED